MKKSYIELAYDAEKRRIRRKLKLIAKGRTCLKKNGR